MLTIPKRGKQKEVETQTAQLKRAKSLDQQTEEPNSPVKAKHACCSCKCHWLVVHKRPTIQLPCCGSLRSWTQCLLDWIIRTSWSKSISDSVQVVEQRLLCGPICLLSFCSRLFQLLWRTSCCQLPRDRASSDSNQVQPPVVIPVHFLQQLSANVNSPF